jgi:hypothetical protein
MEHQHFGYTPCHAHSFEHINYIIDGSGIVLVKTLTQSRLLDNKKSYCDPHPLNIPSFRSIQKTRRAEFHVLCTWVNVNGEII